MFSNVQKLHPTAFLAKYRLPDQSFNTNVPMPEVIKPTWEALSKQKYGAAITLAKMAMKDAATDEERGALLAGRAWAELQTGASRDARRHAGRALELWPLQWTGHRIQLTILSTLRQHQAAYLHMENIPTLGPTPMWDEALGLVERNLALAGWCWNLRDWEKVAEHLALAYPDGIQTMPRPIQEDWFRLALYRNRSEDAAAIAALLINETDAESTDELLQTIVQNGWTKEALPLYRTAYATDPQNQLFRRRLVALCIREGALDEARQLTKPGALGIAA